jgi:hypothetical protein
MIRLGCCTHVASLYPWFVALKVLARKLTLSTRGYGVLELIINPWELPHVLSTSP